MREITSKSKAGVLHVVGIGPGSEQHMTPAATAAIADAEVVIGYSTYIKLVRHLLEGKEVETTGMTEEIGRARAAIQMAQAGSRVALISSGDAGVYGMCGLVFEVLRDLGWKVGDSPKLNVVPGISAVNSCAALVGAPLVHDYCTISLSDLLTPWTVIEKRLEAAAIGDFVVALYNPKSGRRTQQIVEAQRILSQHREARTPVALIKSGWRRRQDLVLTTLNAFLEYEIGMLTTVIIGNTNTFVFEGHMVTPRGYSNKYTRTGELLEGQTKARSLVSDGMIDGDLKELN